MRRSVRLKEISGNPPPRFVSLEHEVYLSLQRLSAELGRAPAELLKTRGLSVPQFNILRVLRGASSGLTCNKIGERLIAYAPDLTRLLDRMALRGLVVRTRESGDRRTVTTRITAYGLALLAELDDPLAALHTRQLGHLGRERLAVLRDLLEAAHPATASLKENHHD